MLPKTRVHVYKARVSTRAYGCYRNTKHNMDDLFYRQQVPVSSTCHTMVWCSYTPAHEVVMIEEGIYQSDKGRLFIVKIM